MFGLSLHLRLHTKSLLERSAKEGDSPVWEVKQVLKVSRVSYTSICARMWESPTPNLKYNPSPIEHSTVRER